MSSSLIIKYVLQSAVSLIIMYAFYALFLRHERNHVLNRFYLLAALIVSMIIPAISPVIEIQNESEPLYYIVLDTISIHADKIQNSVSTHIGLYQIIFTVYLTGATVFLLRFLFQLLQFFILIHKNKKQKEQGYKIIYVAQANPFSFFNYIFLDDQSLNNEDRQKIIDHERQHIRQFHSADLIIAELVLILQWFNPVIWFYRISLREVHEYLADSAVVKAGHDLSAYRQLLLNLSLGNKSGHLGSNFNKSLILKRIKMMTITKQSKPRRLKTVLTFAAGFALSFLLVINPVFQVNAQTTTEEKAEAYDSLMKVLKEKGSVTMEMNGEKIAITSPEKIKNTKPQSKKAGDELVFTVVEDMPEYPGGNAELFKFISSNMKYPEDARQKKIQGTVYVSFVVASNGKIRDVKALRGVCKSIDAEAVRVVSIMPPWKPGTQRGKAVDVAFNMPIKFTLNNGKKAEDNSLNRKTE